MSAEILLLILFGLLLIGVFLGFPVAFIMLGSGLIVGIFGQGFSFFNTLLFRTYGVMEHYELVAIPLFVFMGVMLEKSGVAERLFSAFHYTLGGLRGGLALTTVAICTIMAAATGIVGASVVSMGLFALPAMIKRDYDKALSSGAICAGDPLGLEILTSYHPCNSHGSSSLLLCFLLNGGYTFGICTSSSSEGLTILIASI